MSLRRWILLAVILSMLTGCGGPWDSGDRVLVTKCNEPVMGPNRYDVVVFKYPRGPVDKSTPKNYIKRLMGLPGEILAIFFGRVYHRLPEKEGDLFYDDVKDANVNANDLWQDQYMHTNEESAKKAFEGGKFTILRKPPGVMMALRRIVYDNDFQAKDLVGKLDRWSPPAGSAWKADKATGFASDGKAADKIDWLRYQHLLRPDEIDGVPNQPVAGVKKTLILDTLDYNTGITEGESDRRFFESMYAHAHWVGDLMLECNVEVVEPKGEFCLELSRGINRFQASFDLATGECTLYRLGGKDNKREAPPLAVKPTNLKAPGNYLVRFANIDARLTVWVDRELPFGDGKEYDPPEMRGPYDKDVTDADIKARRGPTDNDFEPASIGSKGANVKIAHLRLWRDIYYRTSIPPHGSITDYDNLNMTREGWSQGSQQLDDMRDRMRFVTMYVQPGHYLCLGDNSQASSDSRDWGLVPRRLMLGRALAVYYPIERIGPIR
jgi:signal peptidase I